MKKRNSVYTAAARRLGKFLTAKYNIAPVYGHMLDAVAVVHGFHDYNTLVGSGSPTGRLKQSEPEIQTLPIPGARLSSAQRKSLISALAADWLDTFANNTEVLEERIRKGFRALNEYTDSELVADASNNLPEHVLNAAGVDPAPFTTPVVVVAPADTLICDYVSVWEATGEISTRGTIDLVSGVCESDEAVEMADDDDILRYECVRFGGKEFELEEDEEGNKVLTVGQLTEIQQLASPVEDEDRTALLLPYALRVDCSDDADTVILEFTCMAEDEEHASEQALDAYPGGEVVPDSVQVDFDTLDVDEDDVAEWVGLHYGRTYDAEPEARQNDWKLRFWQMQRLS